MPNGSSQILSLGRFDVPGKAVEAGTVCVSRDGTSEGETEREGES